MVTRRASARRKRPTNLAAYAGQWVTLAGNRVIAAGPSLPDVMEALPTGGPRHQPSLFLVPRRDEGPYVLLIPPLGC